MFSDAIVIEIMLKVIEFLGYCAKNSGYSQGDFSRFLQVIFVREFVPCKVQCKLSLWKFCDRSNYV